MLSSKTLFAFPNFVFFQVILAEMALCDVYTLRQEMGYKSDLRFIYNPILIKRIFNV